MHFLTEDKLANENSTEPSRNMLTEQSQEDSMVDLAKKARIELRSGEELAYKEYKKSDRCGREAKPSTSGISTKGCRRSLDTIIHMTYNRQHSIFEVTKRSGKCLAFMGVPMKNGGHILFPEEAVYLIEHRNAYATDGGRLLTLYDGYRILQECSVSMHKFRAYSALRQGGFVVLRPNRRFVHSLQLHRKSPSRQIEDPSHSRSLYSDDLLNMFPTLRRNRMYMPPLHHNRNIVPIEDLDDFLLNPCAYELSRKSFHDFRRQIRPRLWPCFDHIRQSASSWAHFALLRKEILNSTTPVPGSSSNSTSVCKSDRRYDFDVFLTDRFTHSRPSPPAFVVICSESRGSTMNCSYVHRSAEENPLVISIYDSGHVCFTEISGKPIDLNQYLKDLTTRSLK